MEGNQVLLPTPFRLSLCLGHAQGCWYSSGDVTGIPHWKAFVRKLAQGYSCSIENPAGVNPNSAASIQMLTTLTTGAQVATGSKATTDEYMPVPHSQS